MTVFQRWVVVPITAQLTQGITPEKLALTIVMACVCAFFPVLGAATPLCLLVGIVLRLNQPLIQIVNAGTSPLYIPVVFLLVRLGESILGARAATLDVASMGALLRHDPRSFIHIFGTIALHAAVGWVALAPFCIGIGYFCLLPAMRAVARRSPFGFIPGKSNRTSSAHG